jgi:HPt (histidine-containing phosphotransfer) domain-containing protein
MNGQDSVDSAANAPVAAGECPVDLNKAMENLGGDRELFDEVLGLFVQTLPQILREVESAIESRDAAKLRLVAHGLKGSAANVCAEPARQKAEEIEGMAKRQDFSQLDQAFAELEALLKQLQDYAASQAAESSAGT